MIVMFLILFLAITTQSSVLHYNLSNNDYSIKLLCMKCIMFCKFIGGETAHSRCLVGEAWVSPTETTHTMQSRLSACTYVIPNYASMI